MHEYDYERDYQQMLEDKSDLNRKITIKTNGLQMNIKKNDNIK